MSISNLLQKNQLNANKNDLLTLDHLRILSMPEIDHFLQYISQCRLIIYKCISSRPNFICLSAFSFIHAIILSKETGKFKHNGNDTLIDLIAVKA